MTTRKPFLLATGCFGGIVLYLMLTLFPVAFKMTQWHALQAEFQNTLLKSEAAEKFPTLTMDNQELHANNDYPFTRRLGTEAEGFYFHVDTGSTDPGSALEQLDSGILAALVLNRDRATFILPPAINETILYKDHFDAGKSFSLNEAKVREYLRVGIRYGLLSLLALLILYHGTGKLIWWAILALFFSSRLKPYGGGASSLALWCLVLPTLLQGAMIHWSLHGIIQFPLYVITLVVTASLFQDRVLNRLEAQKTEVPPLPE